MADRHLELRPIREHQAAAGVRVLAYCLMHNHVHLVHLVVVTERADSLALLLARVYGRYAQYVNIRRERCGHLWQPRYYSCPLFPRHLGTALCYVEDKPCRAGLVERPEDYRYSSAAAHLLGCPERSGILDLGFWERAGGIATWAGMHGALERSAEVLALRKCTYGGRPFGDEEFVREMVERFQRQGRRTAAEQSTETPCSG